EMFKDNVTGEFSTKINLDDGEYTYKFHILSRTEPNQMIDIIDPYATRVEEDEKGTFRSAITKLDYLAYDLGINCIQLMPIQAFLLGHDWGYTIRHYFSVEPSYGSSEDLKSFIDEC
ncbi:unnamed protein product, partial [Adineta steineri]